VVFDEEKARQKAFIKRVEKIHVQYKGVPENVDLLMNRFISTPYNCAMRKCILFIHVCAAISIFTIKALFNSNI